MISSSHAIRVVVMLFSILSLLQPMRGSEPEPSITALLSADDFEYSGMAKVFSHGKSSTEVLVHALDDPDPKINLNAQLMLRLIGEKRGIQGLHDWYQRPKPILRIVNGPIPVPLQEWDYRRIQAILDRPSREWRAEAVDYLFALSIDGSPRAQKFLNIMISAVPQDESPTTISQMVATVHRWEDSATTCNAGIPKVLLRKNAFFLTQDERKSASIKQMAYADNRRLALFTVSHTFGNTFLVVLRRTGSCWKFQSVGIYSTNN